jgi:hypothetical protein
MADIEAMKRALVNADRAGDTAAATMLARALKKQMAAPVSQDRGDPVNNQARIDQGFEDSKPDPVNRGQYNPVASGMLFGFDDELFAGVLSPVEMAKRKIMGQDRASLSESYTDLQRKFDQDKSAYRERNPVSSTLQEAAGGIVSGGGLMKSGLTMMGRLGKGVIPAVTGGAIDGAAYSALVGAGEANPGQRVQGALDAAPTGAVIGGALGGTGQAVGRAIAKWRANRTAAPSIDDLANQAKGLYAQADQAGTQIRPQAMRQLAMQVKAAADKFNDRLRPQTVGVAKDFVRFLDGKPVSLREFDEFRQVVGNAMKGAAKDDIRTLSRIKDAVDDFADNIQPGQVTGDPQGFKFLREARDAYRRKSKAETIARIMDLADVNTGQYTQSGAANTIRREFAKLYKNQREMRAFSAEEKALIRQIARGDTASGLTRFLAKFDPKGVVSVSLGAMTGGGIGSAVGGPLGGALMAAVPGMIGRTAGSIADNAALRAAQAVQANAARGFVPQVGAIPNYLSPLTPITSQEAARYRAR